jgi:hypothetical protein
MIDMNIAATKTVPTTTFWLGLDSVKLTFTPSLLSNTKG